jgi:FAS-associated factor 2
VRGNVKKAESEAAETLAAKQLQWRRWRASRIHPEPSANEKDVVRLALKMPEHIAAARVTRRFRANDSIEEMYAFVECYDIIQSGIEDDVSEPGDYKHAFKFRIVQTLPRVVYAAADEASIGEQIGRSGNLIVEEIKDEDEDNDDDEDDSEE